MSNGMICEPFQVDVVLVTGFSVQVSKHLAEVIGWHSIPEIGAGAEERRVVLRLAMPIDVATELRNTLNAMLQSESEQPTTRSSIDLGTAPALRLIERNQFGACPFTPGFS